MNRGLKRITEYINDDTVYDLDCPSKRDMVLSNIFCGNLSDIARVYVTKYGYIYVLDEDGDQIYKVIFRGSSIRRLNLHNNINKTLSDITKYY